MGDAAPPPQVAVVIAVKDDPRIARCIDSVLAQQDVRVQLLVVDAVSDEPTTAAIAAREERLGAWIREPDGGIYDAWNKAIDRSDAAWTAFLGADDELRHPRALADLLACAEAASADVVFGLGELVDGAGRVLRITGEPFDHVRHRRWHRVCHPGGLHRTELLRQLGGFDDSYRIAADYDLLLRAGEQLRAAHLDEVVVRVADGGVSRSLVRETLRETHRAQRAAGRSVLAAGSDHVLAVGKHAVRRARGTIGGRS